MTFKKITPRNDVKTKKTYLIFFCKKVLFCDFWFGGHITLWLAISSSLNILRRLTFQMIGNWISFKNMCISTISRYVFCDTFVFFKLFHFLFLPSTYFIFKSHYAAHPIFWVDKGDTKKKKTVMWQNMITSRNFENVGYMKRGEMSLLVLLNVCLDHIYLIKCLLFFFQN